LYRPAGRATSSNTAKEKATFHAFNRQSEKKTKPALLFNGTLGKPSPFSGALFKSSQLQDLNNKSIEEVQRDLQNRHTNLDAIKQRLKEEEKKLAEGL
jgi:hypothetical protein